MRRLALTLVPLFLLACDREPIAPEARTAPTFAATHTTSNDFDIPYVVTLQAPCLGEAVYVDGVIHSVVTEIYSASGNYSLSYLGHPQGLTGVGVTSGLPWKFTGATVWTVNVQPDGFPYSETFVDRYHAVGPGGTQYYLKEMFKVTINGVGAYVVTIDESNWECK